MRTFRRKPGEFHIGSVSAITTLNTCERRFWHQYRGETPKDYDYKPPKYFSFGGAVHKVIEWCEHDHHRYHADLVRRACAEANPVLDFDDDGAKVAACVRSYFANFKPIEIIAVEKEIIVGNWVMYIDLVTRQLPNPDRPTVKPWWYIEDIKTTGVKFDPIILTKLAVDPQMMSYAKHAAPIISEEYGLPMEEFFGVRHREIEKPRIKHKPGESFADFTQRCGEPAYRQPELAKQQFRDKEAMANLETALAKAVAFQCESETVQNMRSCVDKGHICAWYSRCYGKTHSQAQFDGLDDEDKF